MSKINKENFMALSREVRAPRGAQLTCKNWLMKPPIA